MKSERDIKRSYIGRFKQANTHAMDLIGLLYEVDPDKLTDDAMEKCRDKANAISQCVHEMNAYRNIIKGTSGNG